MSSRKSRPSVTGSPSQRAASTRRAWPCAEDQRPGPRRPRSRATTRSRRSRHLRRRVSPPGTGCVQTVQPGHGLADLGGGDALVVAVVPLGEVLVDLGVGEARPARRCAGPAAAGWSAPGRSRSPASRSRSAARHLARRRGQRQVGGRGVPAVAAPLGLAVPDQPHGVRIGVNHGASLAGIPRRGHAPTPRRRPRSCSRSTATSRCRPASSARSASSSPVVLGVQLLRPR